MSGSDDVSPAGWDDFAELHMTGDGGGVLSSLKAIRQGTLAELVRFVSSLPEDERRRYVIERSGHRQLGPGEIAMLSRRPDFPRP